MSQLIDTHCHLDFDSFSDDIERVIQRAQNLGVERMVTISTKVRQFERLQALVKQYPSVYCSIGTHPENAALEQDVSIQEIVDLAKKTKVVAIGEAGLDYHYEGASRETQILVFKNHIEAARQSHLPLIIHSRDADDDMANILIEETEKQPFSFILHCYSSGMALAKTGLRLGGYISFSGILTFKNAPEIREVAKIVPLDRLLVETDAPYLAPVPYRGKRNEPAYVLQTAQMLAQTLNMPFEALAQQTTQNAYRIYSSMV